MSARLTSTSVVFGDNTTLSSYYGIIPRNTVTFLYQNFVPLGWSIVATHNDKTLRVVSGSGGGQGGNLNFSTMATVVNGSNNTTISGTVGGTTLSIGQLPQHKHQTGADNTTSTTPNVGNYRSGQGYQINTDQGYTSGDASAFGLNGSSHTHPFPSRAASYSYNLDFQVYYVDVILVKFD